MIPNDYARLGAAAALIAALSAFAARGQPILRAERIELVSAEGVRQAVLAADSGGFVVMVLDTQGRAVSSLRLDGEPWLSVQSENGQEVAGLGSPRVRHLTK